MGKNKPKNEKTEEKKVVETVLESWIDWTLDMERQISLLPLI